MKRFGWTFLFSFFLVVANVHAQSFSLERQIPKDPSAKGLGVRCFNLEVNGEVIGIELFGAEDMTLAKCEVAVSRNVHEVTCDVPKRGRYRVKQWYRGGDFEDLGTGDYFRTRFEVQKELPEGIIEIEPGEDFPTLEGEWIVESSLNEQEIQERWGDLLPLLGLAGAEVLTTLGLPGIQNEPSGAAPAEGFFGCGPGEIEICSTVGGVTADGSGFTSSFCCRNASNNADLLCSLVSGTPCCANSFCTVHPFLGIFFTCTVGGWIHRCVDCEGLHALI